MLVFILLLEFVVSRSLVNCNIHIMYYGDQKGDKLNKSSRRKGFGCTELVSYYTTSTNWLLIHHSLYQPPSPLVDHRENLLYFAV